MQEQIHLQKLAHPEPYRIQLSRRKPVLEQCGFCNTHLHNLIKKNLFPSPVSLGGLRAVGWIQSEVDQTLAFMIAGKSKEDIRALVSHMVEQRKNAANGLGA